MEVAEAQENATKKRVKFTVRHFLLLKGELAFIRVRTQAHGSNVYIHVLHT